MARSMRQVGRQLRNASVDLIRQVQGLQLPYLLGKFI